MSDEAFETWWRSLGSGYERDGFAPKVAARIAWHAARRGYVPQPAWISVKDRLPADQEPVVGLWARDYRDGFATKQTCYYDGTMWRTWNTGTFDARLIWPVYWMPLPSAPAISAREEAK